MGFIRVRPKSNRIGVLVRRDRVAGELPSHAHTEEMLCKVARESSCP